MSRRAQSHSKPVHQKQSLYENEKQRRKDDEYYNNQQGRSGQQMGQHMKQNQKLIQDQHFSNNTMMNVFSTMESLGLNLNEQRPRKEQKMFGYYDKVNYDNKNIEQLKSQLQTHILLYKSSLQCFSMENPMNSYTFSNNFSQNRALQECRNYENLFSSKKETDLVDMCRDFESLLSGKFKGTLRCENKSYTIKSSIRSGYNAAETIKNVMHASNEMDYEGSLPEANKINHSYDLPIHVNSAFRQQEKSNQQYYHNRNHNY